LKDCATLAPPREREGTTRAHPVQGRRLGFLIDPVLGAKDPDTNATYDDREVFHNPPDSVICKFYVNMFHSKEIVPNA